MKKIIEVTQDDINNGKPTKSCDCPIARAIMRETGQWVSIGGSQFDTVEGKCGSLPPLAIDFIYRFDRGQTVVPFSFELEIPC